MKEQFKKILEKHCIYGETPEEVLYAVSDMLDFVADRLREEEPYATNTIKRLENSAYECFNLAVDLEEE